MAYQLVYTKRALKDVRDFRSAEKSLGLKVMNPTEFVIYLSEYIYKMEQGG